MRHAFFLFLSFIFFLSLILSCTEDQITNPPDDNDDDDVPIETGYQQYGEPFDQVPAAGDVVMYEVNLRAFSATQDLSGVTQQLDSIAQLGINTIWLMPIYPIGQVNSVNSPYSIKDYRAVNPEFGTLEDLRHLVEEAHVREMAVILDWVANHTSWDNDWINNKDWYTQDAGGNIVHPPGTNWQDVADLNFDNTTMRDSMIDAMKYWVLEANVDGYRCDYANGVPFDFWEQAIDTLRNIPNRDLILLAEGDRNDHFDAGFDLAFSWRFYGTVKDVFNGLPASRLFNTHNSEYNNIPSGKHWLRFTTNHDESAWDATPVSIFNGTQGATCASVLTIFTGGVPLIYGSQEVGVSQTIPFFSTSTINWNANPAMKQTYRQMLQFYGSSEAARTGENAFYTHADIACFKKMLGSDEVLVIANVRNKGVVFDIPTELRNTTWTNILTGEEVPLVVNINLAPYHFLILD